MRDVVWVIKVMKITKMITDLGLKILISNLGFFFKLTL